MNKLVISILALTFSHVVHADSELLSKIENDKKICSLFSSEGIVKENPNAIIERKYFRSKKNDFDGNNSGSTETLYLKEKFTRYETNMAFYAFPLGLTPRSTSDSKMRKEASYVFPLSWMHCRNTKSKCSIEEKAKDGIFEFGEIPGRKEPIVYRARYTNVFPFFVDGITYYKVTTESHAKDIVSIVKPEKESIKLVCAFRTGKRL